MLNREYFKAAGEPKTLWEIPEARHVGGLAARPAEYERRVVAFFDQALLNPGPPGGMQPPAAGVPSVHEPEPSG